MTTYSELKTRSAAHKQAQREHQLAVWAAKSPEEREAWRQRCIPWLAYGRECQKEMSPEDRRERSLKGWQTRRAKQAVR